MNSEQLDARSINAFQASGDPAELEPLMSRHLAKVHGLAFKMLGDQSRADDVTQDVFLKVFSGLGSFKQESKFSTWLYRITINTIYSLTEKASKLEKQIGEFEKDIEHASVGSKVSTERPEQTVLGEELLDEIDRELRRLNKDFRAAIVLTAFQGLSPGEAAEVVDCTPQTFYWRLHEARKQLKHGLRRYLET